MAKTDTQNNNTDTKTPANKAEDKHAVSNNASADNTADSKDKKSKDVKETKEKKEKVLTPKQLEKKLAQEKLERKKQNRLIKYKLLFETDEELNRRQFTEKRDNKKKIIINAIVLLVGLGVAVFLMSIMQILVAIAIPFAIVTLFNIVRSILMLRKLKNPYELRKILILEKAKKAHKDRNQKILEAYKAEKRRIKMLKNLPYKILNGMAFIISMFTIILFFFVLDIGIEKTALILFGMFFVTYFVVGLLMLAVFYLVSENKQRLLMFKLEEEKNKLLLAEKLRNEESVRNKLANERRRYEEEERLRIEEQIRVAQEEEEQRLKFEEEQRLMEEAEEEKRKLIQESKLLHTEATPKISRAEYTKESEVMRNELDKGIIGELRQYINQVDISGIEDFTGIEDFSTEFATGPIIPDIDMSDEAVNTDMDNSLLQTPAYPKDDDYLADVTDIEEAKTLVYAKAMQMSNKSVKKDTPPPPPASTDGANKGKNVSGKSFMILKEMIKDG
ncbi:MAG: hypothetical protein LBO69_03875 [Ignavibacteria bacterium]|jgi:hypothetical protein|nr:hypothetical protein [Ignavibacteria bacterium]